MQCSMQKQQNYYQENQNEDLINPMKKHFKSNKEKELMKIR